MDLHCIRDALKRNGAFRMLLHPIKRKRKSAVGNSIVFVCRAANPPSVSSTNITNARADAAFSLHVKRRYQDFIIRTSHCGCDTRLY